MVRGLEQELQARLAGKTISAQRDNFPSSSTDIILPAVSVSTSANK
jgi:hypothetical protein